jgi:hypothetical protein
MNLAAAATILFFGDYSGRIWAVTNKNGDLHPPEHLKWKRPRVVYGAFLFGFGCQKA